MEQFNFKKSNDESLIKELPQNVRLGIMLFRCLGFLPKAQSKFLNIFGLAITFVQILIVSGLLLIPVGQTQMAFDDGNKTISLYKVVTSYGRFSCSSQSHTFNTIFSFKIPHVGGFH